MKSNKIKYYFGGFIALCLIGFGWFLNDNLTNKNIEVNPKYGDIVIKKDSAYKPIIYVFEMAKHVVDVINIYTDENNDEHQFYLDTLNIKKDTLELSLITSVDVNIEKKQSLFSYRNIKVKSLEKTVTILKEIPKYITEYKPIPFYRNHWFYAWLGTASLLVLMVLSLFS